MGLKSSFKGCKEPQCDDLIVDKNIGTSYDIVREVYDALPWLEDLYNDAPEDAPGDSKTYGRQSGDWVEVTEEAPNDGQGYVRRDNEWVIEAGANSVEEAPEDGTPYNRQDADWVSVEVTEAPETGSPYGREDLGWVSVTEEAPDNTTSYVRKGEEWIPETTGIPEASTDSKYYGRFNSSWAEVTEEAADDSQSYVRKSKGWVPETTGIPDATSDGTAYGREDAGWVSVTEEAPDTAIGYVRKGKAWVAESGGEVEEAPTDGFVYGRESSNWVEVPEEAPDSGLEYVRKSKGWVQNSGGGSGIGEAPEDGTPYNREDANWVAVEVQEALSDGQEYVRKNGAWSVATGGGGGIGEAPTDGRVYVRNGLAVAWEVGVPEANNNTVTYGRKGLAWVAVPEEANQDAKSYVRKDGGWVEESPGEVEEAPEDGTSYVRNNAGWVSETVGEAPNDAQEYVRKSEGWAVSSGGGGGIPEAPTDGKVYVRDGLNAEWDPGVPEAADDSTTYGREGLAWIPVTEEAPDNGDEYVRKNKTWAVATGGGGGGDSASMPEVTFEANRNQWGDKLAASGFVHFGKHQDTGDYSPINQGLFARVNSGSHTNVLYMGDSNSGESKTDYAVTSIAKVITRLDELNIGSDPKKGKIKFPASPDGTVTYNTATGEILKHGSASGAFAAESNDVSVVTERVDLWGFEQFLRKIENTGKGKWVFPNGLIQSKAVNINGISTVPVPSGDIPDTYFAVFHYTATDGTVIETDTSSRGLGVDWFSLSSSDQDTILADPANKIYRDSNGDLLVHEIRQRTVPGVGNGDFTAIDIVGSTAMLNKTDWYVPPQGELEELKTGVTLGHYDNGFYVPPNDSGNRADKSTLGHYTAQRGIGDDFAVNDECYFLIGGTVPRINQGAYHHFHNPWGSSKWNGANGDSYYWYNASANTPFTRAAAFVVTTSDSQVGRPRDEPDSGSISSGGSGRISDGKFHDVIYTGGMGGVIDDRLSSWDASSSELAGDVMHRMTAGEYRGKQQLTTVVYALISDTSAASTTAYTLQYPLGGAGLDSLPFTGTEHEPCDGYVTLAGTQHRINSYRRESGGSDIFVTSNTMSDTGEAAGQAITDHVMWVQEGPSVSGQFTNFTLVARVSNLLNTSELAQGWMGDWCRNPPAAGSNPFPLGRKSVEDNDELIEVITENDGSSWTSQSNTMDPVANERVSGASSTSSRFYVYPTLAHPTKASDNTAIFHGRRGQHPVYLSADHKPEEGCILAESLIKKVLTSDDESSRSTTIALQVLGRMESDGKLATNEIHYPQHQRVIVAEPTNQGSGLKALTSQISVDSQASLQFHAKELFYDETANDESEAVLVSTSVSYDYLEGEFYKFDHANFGDFDQMYVISATEFSTAAGQIAGYTQIGDVILSVNGRLRFYIWTGDASAWGDNGSINIVDGDDVATDVNGNEVAVTCHHLALPIGWIRNDS